MCSDRLVCGLSQYDRPFKDSSECILCLKRAKIEQSYKETDVFVHVDCKIRKDNAIFDRILNSLFLIRAPLLTL